jgi:carbamoyltransferase
MRTLVEELPGSVGLLRKGSSSGWDSVVRSREALLAPARLRKQLGLDSDPTLIMFPHHENHASMAFAASPFAKDNKSTMIAVIDGSGDHGSVSHYQNQTGNTRLKETYSNDCFADSLGIFYTILSSSQGGWTPLSSEGRYMGAVAWGDQDRHTNPYYRRLRELFHFGPLGQVRLNRKLANWQNAGELDPYTPALEGITGPPVPRERMWNPDAILNVESVQHSDITRQRVDLAAATQLVFEDYIFHMVDHMIRSTSSEQLVLAGGSALNGIANMKLMEHFNRAWYKRNLGLDTCLKLWIPPTPGDAGVTIGSAYSLAIRADVPVGPNLQHAAYCGISSSANVIETALASDAEVHCIPLGNVSDEPNRKKVADLMAYIIAQDGVLGLYQGPAETGPRALGQRSILANPCNPATRAILNERVKQREAIRPLAPMVSRAEANRFFELAEGAAADDYNAYRYMVLTTKARPEAYEKIPSVVHRDGTCRIQIVEPDIQPLLHDYLQAMGRRLGAEVSVNTSLNVGGPICQTPTQAIATMKRAKALTGLVMVSEEGVATLVWHAVETEIKDKGAKLLNWVKRHTAEMERAA